MNRLHALIGAYWVAMTLLSLVVVIYRKPVAGWFRPRMRYWRNRPDAQRLYERSLLLGGIGVAAFSAIVLYVHLIIIPTLDATFKQIRSANEELQRQTRCTDPI